jgi:dTMP kinase
LSGARFITLEGGEGAGKTTQVRRLVERLGAAGIDAIATREPGGAPGAERIRSLLVSGDTDWRPMTEALLHNAARVEHVATLVRPSLATGTWVVSDRYVDSTLAYQGSAQGVGADAVRALHRLALGGLMPDLTLVLDLPVELGLARAKVRAGGEDRYERMGAAFHQRLRDAYLAIATAEPERCVVIDAAADVDTVAARLWSALAERFNLRG